MNTFDKIRAFCRPFRIVAGIILIIVGILKLKSSSVVFNVVGIISADLFLKHP